MSTASVARVYSEASQMKDYFEEEKEKIEKKKLKEMAKEHVDVQIFKNGLSCLGKTFNNARHAYLNLNISNNNLVSIVGIDKFKYLQVVDVSNNKLINLKDLSHLKHMIKLNASWNQIRKTFDFEPPANLEYVDYSGNLINKIERADQNVYLKTLILDSNNIQQIEGLQRNRCLKILSLNGNSIDTIENLDGLFIEELYIKQNRLRKITGVNRLHALKTLDVSQNQISKLKGLQETESLRFLKVQLNTIGKIGQLAYIENLPLLTDLDLSCNPIQNRKFYRLQVLFHIPQLRDLDGVKILAEEKIKAENLHGLDQNDRELIFQSLLPEEKFVDRRINVVDDIPLESESEAEQISFIEQRYDANGGLLGASRDMSSHGNGVQKVTHSGTHSVHSRISHPHGAHTNQYSPRSSVGGNHAVLARQYVGELMQRVNFE